LLKSGDIPHNQSDLQFTWRQVHLWNP
jgi:hypothetical protein